MPSASGLAPRASVTLRPVVSICTQPHAYSGSRAQLALFAKSLLAGASFRVFDDATGADLFALHDEPHAAAFAVERYTQF